MNIKKRKNIKVLISVIIFISAIGIAYFLSFSKWQEINSVDSQIKQMEALISAKKSYYANIDSKIEALNSAGWDQKKDSIAINFDSSLFFTPKINNFFRTIVASSGMSLDGMTSSLPEGTSSQSQAKTTTESGAKTSKVVGTTQTSVQQNSDVLQGSIRKTAVNLNVSGTYNNFKNLLSLFEGQTRIVTIKSIAVSSAATQEKSKGKVVANNYNFSIILDVYSY